MIHAFGPGVFPRPALNTDGRRGYLAFREGDPKAPGYVVVCGWADVAADHFVGLHEVARFPVGGESPAFPDVTVHHGLVWVAYHDGSVGHLRCVTTGVHESMAPCENNAPIVFGAGCVAWQGAASDGWPISLMDLSSGEVEPAGNGQGTGLAYITADRRVVLVDANRMTVSGLVNPDRAGELLVGEDPDPANRDNLSAPWRVGHVSGRLWATSPCITPRAAAAGGRFAIATWGQGADVRLFCGSLEDLVAASVAAPPPQLVPQPVPPPIPEPTSMTYVRRSPDLTDAVSTCTGLFPVEWDLANKKSHGHRTDAFARKAASWIAANVDPNVGLNGKRGDEDDLSHDAFSYLNPTGPGGVEVIDFITGEDHEPAWQDVTIPPLPHPQGRAATPGGVLGKYVAPAPWTGAGGDGGDPGDEDDADPDDVQTSADRPEHLPVLALLSSIGMDVLMAQRAIRALPAPEKPLPHVCPPCPPCELSHGSTVLPVGSEPELQAIVDGWARAFAGGTRRIMPPELTTYLLYRFLFEGVTDTQNIEEARTRGR